MEKNAYTKDSIRARMFKRATALWEIRNVDMLDPVVKLLIEALASEIFKLSGDMNDVEDRIVEKLAGSFTPAHMMSAAPAHAVVHARSVEGRYDISSDIEFVYKDPYFIQKHNLRKLSFTPTREVPIINGDVAAQICKGKYYEVTPRGGKEHSANSSQQSSSFTNTAWVGLEVSKEVESLRDVSFYFDFPLLDNNDDYLRLIKHSKWFHGNEQITIVPGSYSNHTNTGVFELFDQRQHINDEVASKYQNHFITIADDVQVSSLKCEAIPKEITDLFDNTVVSKLRSDLVWFKIVFPPAFDDTALSYIVAHINCFPIENVYKKHSIVTTSRFSSTIPLEKEDNEYFLFMDSVSDSKNNLFKQIQNHSDNIAGTYMIRRGGSEKFNSLNARDFLERLLDLYRDESIAFSSIDRDISSTAQELMGNLSEFEKKLESYNDDSEHTSYLVLGSDISKRTNLSMYYCLTNGTIANNIRSAEMLEVPKIADINPQSTILMTTTRGGRRSPRESSRKDIYRYLLTTRDRIYTKDDIRMYCRCYYGDYFTNVRVDDAYEISNKPKQGFVKILKVVLEGAKEKSLVDTEFLKKDVLSGLEQRSPEDFEYRIIIA